MMRTAFPVRCLAAVFGVWAVILGIGDRIILGDEASAKYLVGTAKVEITPDYPVRLAGYASRRDEVSKVAQPIHVRALAIGDDSTGGPVVLVNVETCGFPADLVETVCRKIAEKASIDRSRIAVCSTHTHSAPWVLGYAPYISNTPVPEEHLRHLKRFRRELEEKIVEAAVTALRHRRPATLAWGRGKVGFAANRRVLRDGVWRGFGVQPDGPTDPRLPVLVARDEKGVPIAVLVGYACHCTTLGGDYMQIAGDWAGFAQEAIEKDYPQATAVVVIGCGADANPEPRGKFEFARQHGLAVGREVKRLLSQSLRPIRGKVRCRFDRVALPLGELPPREQWEQWAKRTDARGRWAAHFLRLLDEGKPLPTSVDYAIGTWTFGDSLAMVFLAGEVVVDYAIRIDREFDPERVWTVAYANDVPCYIPSKRILKEGGYEADSSMVYYGKPTRFAPEVEDIIIDTVQRLLPHEYYSQEKQRDFPPPKNPEEARRAIRVPPGLRVELVAAEPLVVDPIAFDWGPDGALWVVEMRDYPEGMDGKGKPGGRIKRLTDTDGDGKYDRADVFVDGLAYPTGVKVWRRGILVSCAPEILYFEDRDGDGRAEHREVLFRGFGEGNQQHRVNGLRFGLDNWIYIGNGESGGAIVSLKTGKKVSVRGRDLRIDPDTGAMETQSGQTQYGRCEDDWGNWFGGNNSDPIWHYVLDEQYLRRNPHLRSMAVRRSICVPPGAAPVYPASRTLARFNDFDRVDRFTSACSPIIYRDRWLGNEYYGNVFVCEPVHDLVYRGVMRPEGYSFRVTRAEAQKNSEFFASTDNWSRPVMVRTGPDGALWVADMYRFVIEHPEWIPYHWRRKLDVRAGEELGRIYRIVPDTKGARPFPKLTDRPPSAWVEALASPNAWTRSMAQQLILWRGGEDLVPALEELVRRSDMPLARLHALYTLDGLDQLSDAVLRKALADRHPGVVRHAVKLSEDRLDENDDLRQAVLAVDPARDAQLRLQLAYSLGACHAPEAARRLGELLASYGEDGWFRRAALSSLRNDNVETVVLVALEEYPNHWSSLSADLLEQSVAFESFGAARAIVVRALDEKRSRRSAWSLAGQLTDLLGRARGGPQTVIGEELWRRIGRQIEEARRTAADAKASLEDRLAATALLGRDAQHRQEDLKSLSELLRPQVAQPLQLAAVARLARLRAEGTSDALLEHWSSLSPRVRERVLDALFSRTAWTLKLLDRVEAGEVTAVDLGAARLSMLRQHHSEEVRTRAERLLSQTVDTNRAEVVAQRAADVRQLSGNAAQGKKVFEKRCSTCHQLEGVGNAIGPDLLALSDRSTSFLLTAIFDPNRALEDRYQSYVAALTDGRVMSGLLLAEAANSVTLVDQEGRQHVLLRSEIEQIKSTGKSLMPEGLEKELSPQDTADVIAYLQSFQPKPKSFPGNEPQPAPVRDDGSFRLFAIHARIYGPSLVFEPEHRNLGYWKSDRDWAAWDVDVTRAGKYRVVMFYACAPESAGNRYLLTIGGQSLTGEIASTGGWANYRSVVLGTVELTTGRTEAVMRADGSVQGALCDLRAIYFLPVGD